MIDAANINKKTETCKIKVSVRGNHPAKRFIMMQIYKQFLNQQIKIEKNGKNSGLVRRRLKIRQSKKKYHNGLHQRLVCDFLLRIVNADDCRCCIASVDSRHYHQIVQTTRTNRRAPTVETQNFASLQTNGQNTF